MIEATALLRLDATHLSEEATRRSDLDPVAWLPSAKAGVPANGHADQRLSQVDANVEPKVQ